MFRDIFKVVEIKGLKKIQMSEAELRKMLDHARKQYIRTIMPKDAVFWRKRIQDLEAELRELDR